MLVTFHTPSHENVVYLGKDGLKLLKLMGRTGDVPGALDADRIAEAITNLEHALAAPQEEAPDASGQGGDRPEEFVELPTRALPLLDLLKAALASEDYVSWD